jgi:hypothetical protein
MENVSRICCASRAAGSQRDSERCVTTGWMATKPIYAAMPSAPNKRNARERNAVTTVFKKRAAVFMIASDNSRESDLGASAKACVVPTCAWMRKHRKIQPFCADAADRRRVLMCPLPDSGHFSDTFGGAYRKRSVASTSSCVLLGSNAECPASGTMCRSASGQALCKSHALRIGHTVS